MVEADDFDCVRCGACCVATTRATEGYVDLTARDLRLLPPAYRARAARMTPPRMPTRVRGAATTCAALRGTLGRRVACAIYDARPTGCRKLRPGSRACRILRELVLDVVDA
jgi:Fe-S-cluster containining protein